MIKRLSVEGMTCQNCVKKIKKIIEKHVGVTEVEVILEAKEATFNCKADENVAGIVQDINDFGFSATEK